MRLLIRLLLTALVLHGAYRIGSAYWQHYTFEDAVRETVQFAPEASAEAIGAQVLELAEEMDIPLVPQALQVTSQPNRLSVTGSYSRPVEVLPRVPREWHFSFDVRVVKI